MIEAQLNYFDIAVISIMLLSCVFAFFRGFVREVLSLGAWVGAGIVTVYYFPQVSTMLEPHLKKPMFAAAFGTLGLYIVSLIGFSIINRIIIKFVKSGSDVGILDNLLGLAFGAVRGALIVAIGFFLLTIAIGENHEPEWMEKAATRPFAEKGALILARLAPSYLEDLSDIQKDATDKIQGNVEKADKEAAEAAQEKQEQNGADGDSGASKLQKLLNDMSKE